MLQRIKLKYLYFLLFTNSDFYKIMRPFYYFIISMVIYSIIYPHPLTTISLGLITGMSRMLYDFNFNANFPLPNKFTLSKEQMLQFNFPPIFISFLGIVAIILDYIFAIS